MTCRVQETIGLAVLVVALGGCNATAGGHTGSRLHSDHAGLHLSIGLGAAASNVIVGGAMLGILAAGDGYAPVPPMKADRTVNEQDCGKPIEQPTANLRCR
jgi:hypothetical protein